MVLQFIITQNKGLNQKNRANKTNKSKSTEMKEITKTYFIHT